MLSAAKHLLPVNGDYYQMFRCAEHDNRSLFSINFICVHRCSFVVSIKLYPQLARSIPRERSDQSARRQLQTPSIARRIFNFLDRD